MNVGNSLAVQWLELCAFTAKGPGFNPQSRNLRSHKPCGMAKKKKEKKKILGFPPMSGNIFKEYMQINSYTQIEKILTV